MTPPEAPISLGVLEVKAPCFSEAAAEGGVRELFNLEADADRRADALDRALGAIA